ncbi:DUF6973 domain-containing protein [Pyxidicoccus trucidator]|uniref:DUF6973 domain-containing protein n=1 Tax=Pyxidicoccus trucidator TaxID=2709662 RepID=UPI0013DCAF6F|nr:hypothetical protein [Pyxidicoccus trucidator]
MSLSIGRDLIGGIAKRLGVGGAEQTRATTQPASVSTPEPQQTRVPGWDGTSSFEAESAQGAATARQLGGPAAATRPDLGQIQRDYQVEDDQVVEWSPKAGGFIPIPFTPEYDITATEAKMLDGLSASRGLVGLNTFNNIKDQALETSTRLYPPPSNAPGHVPEDRVGEWKGQDGHRDAFRHAYWNALMTREFGAEWTQQFATAHEGLPGNPADREAMDLYNNEVGRQIAIANPNASPEELATLVQQAVTDGRTVVLDQRGELQWSDRVPLWQHGLTDNVPGQGGQPRPDGNASPDQY